VFILLRFLAKLTQAFRMTKEMLKLVASLNRLLLLKLKENFTLNLITGCLPFKD